MNQILRVLVTGFHTLLKIFAFYRYIQQIVEAGFTNSIMFGSDQMVWPGVIDRSIKVIEDAPLLTQQQKRDMLYNNAARFLRLTPEQIAVQRRGL